MDLLEKINRSFGTWYEGLFGGAGNDVRPKDILRRILATLEDNRKEGFDNRVYVPNHYVLEINVHDAEEKEYLLSFLDRGELETAIRRYCQQNHYHIRGALHFEIKEVEDLEFDARQDKSKDKIRIRCRYQARPNELAGNAAANPAPGVPATSSHQTPPNAAALPGIPVEERTVASIYAQHDQDGEESGTVPSVAYGELVVYPTDRAPYRYTIARGTLNLGRSARSNNDIVLESDSQISKQHARIELGADSQFTITDLGSTNGTRVNGKRLETRSQRLTLRNGDEITLGATRLVFQQTGPLQESQPDLATNWPTGNADAARTVAVEPQYRQPPALPVPGRDSFRAPVNPSFVNPSCVNPSYDAGSSGPAPPIREIRARTARLVLVDTNVDIDDFLLASETVIGRGVTNDIVLPDRSIATRHARIVHTPTGYTLESLGNAVTLLNGMAMPAGYTELLKDGDSIGLGELSMRFESGQQG